MSSTFFSMASWTFWFEKLSRLSAKCDAENDSTTFQQVLDSKTNVNTGVDFIIHHLAGDLKTSHYSSYMLEDVIQFNLEVLSNGPNDWRNAQ